MHKLSQVTTTDWDLSSGEGNSVTLVNRYSVGDTLTTVEDGTSGLTISEQRKYCLISNIELWHFEFGKPETVKVISVDEILT